MQNEPNHNDDKSEIKNDLPKLVLVSGKTDDAVNYILDEINNYKEGELIAMMHSVYSENISAHPYRGYQIINNREVEICKGQQRPVWYVFYGMGSQWPGMGKELMCIPAFANSIRQCAEVLKPLGINILDLILNGTKETFDNVLNSYVTIVAIEVALVNLLTLLGIKPDGIFGHSFGEVACAYADGAFTVEQSVLAAYWRGKSVIDTKLADYMGMIIVIGLSWEEVKKRCPPDVFPSGHNGPETVAVSGPKASLDKFTTELEAENIIVKAFNTAGIAFHSKYIADAGPKLLENLKKIIPNPKKRTSKWISTSVPESDWSTPLAQLSSPEYHVNNFLGPVLFYQCLTHIPPNSIVIEIAPHCLFESLFKKSLPSTSTIIGLHKKDHSNNLGFFFTNIGKLFNAGLQPQIAKIYPSNY